MSKVLNKILTQGNFALILSEQIHGQDSARRILIKNLWRNYAHDQARCSAAVRSVHNLYFKNAIKILHGSASRFCVVYFNAKTRTQKYLHIESTMKENLKLLLTRFIVNVKLVNYHSQHLQIWPVRFLVFLLNVICRFKVFTTDDVLPSSRVTVQKRLRSPEQQYEWEFRKFIQYRKHRTRHIVNHSSQAA